jgi:hypothetical protein
MHLLIYDPGYGAPNCISGASGLCRGKIFFQQSKPSWTWRSLEMAAALAPA